MMNTTPPTRWITFAAAMMLCAATAEAQRRDREMPTRVEQAVHENFPGAEVQSVGRERESQVMYYEVNLRYKGNRIEVEVAPDGTIGEVEAVVAIEDVPPAVMDAFEQRLGSARVLRVEKHERWGTGRGGTFVPLREPRLSYEVKYLVNGRRREMSVRYQPTDALTSEARGTIGQAYPDAQIRDVTVMRKDGVELFVVVLARQASLFEVRVAADGTMMQVSDDVDPNAVPAAVRQVAAAGAPRGRIVTWQQVAIHAVVDGGNITPLSSMQNAYRATIEQEEQIGRITIAPDGRVIEALEWRKIGESDDDEDDDDDDNDNDNDNDD
jgi:hypothetical protein